MTPTPPAQRYRYSVGAKPVQVGQRKFEPGTVLGEGNIELAFPDSALCDFDPAEDYDGPHAVEAGHIYARLQAGSVLAEAIESSGD